MRTRNTKYPPFLALLMMAMALVGCKDCEGIDTFNNIVCENSPQTIDESGTATLVFRVFWSEEYGDRPISEIDVTFTAIGGTCTSSARTDSNGEARCVFRAPNPIEFEGGSVTASVKHLHHNTEHGSDEMGGYRTAEGVVLPMLRPSKSKAKPKIQVVEEPLVGEGGKTLFKVKLTEQEIGGVKEEPLPGREIRFETDPEKGTVTEKAITDEKGEAGAEFEPKDPENFEGADVTAKATVKYSDGSVDVETKIPIQKPIETGYRLTAQESPQKAQRLGNDCVFMLEKLTDGVPEPLANAKVTFTAENGKIDASFQEGTTNADGLVRTFFKVDDLLTFDGGKVLASAVVEENPVQATLEIEPAEIGFRFEWNPDHRSPSYYDGEADFSFIIAYTVQEHGQEVTLSYASEGDISIETNGSDGEILSPEDAANHHFKEIITKVKYCIDKKEHANTYPQSFPGDKLIVKVKGLKEYNKLPEGGLVTEAVVDRFVPEFSFTSSYPNKLDDKNMCTVKFTYMDRLTGNPLKVKVKYEIEGGECTEEAESDEKGEINCVVIMDPANVAMGGVLKGTVLKMDVDGCGMISVMPIEHQATIDPVDMTYTLEPLAPGAGFDASDEATVTFQLTGKEIATGLIYTELPDRKIFFESTNVTTDAYSGEWKKTDKNGQVAVKVKAKDATKDGQIKARFEYLNEEGSTVKVYSPVVTVSPMSYMLRCLNSPQMADESGAAELRFELEGINGYTADLYPNVPGRVIYLTPANGSCPPEVTTNNDGKATISFQLTDASVQGSAEALFKYKVNGQEKQVSAVGVVEPFEEDVIEKAKKLKDNVYVIKNKRTGVEEVRAWRDDMNEWRVSKSSLDGTPRLMVTLEDAGEEDDTRGMAWLEAPFSMIGSNTAITPEFLKQNPGFVFGFGKYVDGLVGCKIMTDSEGNPPTGAHFTADGKSKILIRPTVSGGSNVGRRNAPRRGPENPHAYDGLYELLFYLEFTNYLYDYNTDQEYKEDDYIVYGRGSATKHIPTITSFEFTIEGNLYKVKVGESFHVQLYHYYEEEATWDWNDVVIAGCSTDYSDARNNNVDEGYFSWDPTTQLLTALKSSNSTTIYVKMALKSKPSVYRILYLQIE